MILKLDELTPRDRYAWMIGTIIPRPIAFVSSRSILSGAFTPNAGHFVADVAQPRSLRPTPGLTSATPRGVRPVFFVLEAPGLPLPSGRDPTGRPTSLVTRLT